MNASVATKQLQGVITHVIGQHLAAEPYGIRISIAIEFEAFDMAGSTNEEAAIAPQSAFPPKIAQPCAGTAGSWVRPQPPASWSSDAGSHDLDRQRATEGSGFVGAERRDGL